MKPSLNKAVSQLWRPTLAAQEVGIARSTIYSAMEEGSIPIAQTACGLMLVSLEDVQHYADNRPRRGPKKQTDKEAKS